jgi:tetratricopeptide (TPR) repeat protein
MLKRISTKALMVLVALLMLGAANAMAEGGLKLTLPDLDWALRISSPGFDVESGAMRPDGLATKVMAVNNSTGMVMSAFIEPAQTGGDSRVAREYYSNGLKESPPKEDDIAFSEDGEAAILEYFIREYRGVPINQRHVNVYYVRDGFWIDVHLSKTECADSDKWLFDDVLASISFVDGYVQSEMDNWLYASQFYMEDNLPKAIIYYENALEKDRNSTELPEDLWRVAVDNLGMAYGMSGDLKNSQRVLLYGIEQDPDYPMFYYNAACTYAEMNDKEKSLTYLRMAYERKANMIEGETFPDPRTDSSFQRYLNDPQFVALLEEVEG